MSQIYHTFLPRDGSNPVVGDINMTKHRITHLGKPAADDDAVKRKYVNNSINIADVALAQLKEDVQLILKIILW